MSFHGKSTVQYILDNTPLNEVRTQGSAPVNWCHPLCIRPWLPAVKMTFRGCRPCQVLC